MDDYGRGKRIHGSRTKDGDDVKVSKDEYDNRIIIIEVGDGFIYKGEAIRVIEVDEDIWDIKIKYVSNGIEEWIKDSQLDGCQVIARK